jgi:hypothetical protein
MRAVEPTSLGEYIRGRREHDLPTHVVVEEDPRAQRDETTAAAEAIAELVAGDGGAIIRDREADLGANDVVLLNIGPAPREAINDWQKYKELARITRRADYGGVVATVPEHDTTTEVYRVADIVVRVAEGGVEGVYWPRMKTPGGDVHLVELDWEVVDE